MKSLTQQQISKLTFSAEELSILRVIGEYQGKQALYFQQSPEILKGLQQVAIIESSESSNRLEGITASYDRIADMVIKNTKPKDRSEQEIAGYRDALNLIHQSAQHMPLSTNVILQLHAWLYRYLPEPGGQWKTMDNEIVQKYPDGRQRIRFVPCTAFETPHAMESLTTQYQRCIQEWNLEPLLIVPATVLDFLCIHPFRDGNGRTARLITLLLLYHFDFQVCRYISLERIIEDSKETYYESLEMSSKGWHQGKHDLKPWLTYFWGILIRAYKEFKERVGTVTTQGKKSHHVCKAIENMVGPFSIADIERRCPAVSKDTIRLVFRQLREKKLIRTLGKGRGTKWIRNSQ